MIDRKARDQMAEAIRAYMEDRATAFKLDDSLWKTARTTTDSTVRTVAELLWYHYDDLKDHKIVASKEEWDYFNRLLLLLASEAEGELVKTRRPWPFRQAIAALCLAGLVFVAFKYGLGKILFVYMLASGALSMLLMWLTSRRPPKPSSAEIAITPFPSVASLLFLRRRLPGFTRKRYPREIAGRRIRRPFVEKLMRFPMVLLLLVASPIVLLLMVLPDREFNTRVRIPEPSPPATVRVRP